MRGVRRLMAVAVAAGLVLTACADGDAMAGVDVAQGWSLGLVRDDLERPTQLATDGETVHVAELVGEEGAGNGRVRDLGGPIGEGTALLVLDDLVVPTGLVVLDDGSFVVQEGRELARHDLLDEPDAMVAPAAERSVLTGDLPWNGRSQGSLTLLDDGRVLHSSTHEGEEPDLTEGSGAVYATAPDGSGDPEPVAVGFKVPYAHAVDGDGRLWVTDIGDGRVDGVQVREELHRFDAFGGDDVPHAGWPMCTGGNVPVAQWGATEADCAATQVPVATFPPRSTPTGLAIGADGRVLVSLFTTPTVRGGVVEVHQDGTVSDVVRGLETPHDLLALDDGSFLLTTHLGGQLFRLTPP